MKLSFYRWVRILKVFLRPAVYLILLLFLSSGVFSQSYNFRNYSVEHGLPFIQVYSVFQDSRGYLWSGGYGGLSRFDGQEFVNFSPKNGLLTHWVTSITEDHHGHLWVGTPKGLTMLRIKELKTGVEKIENYTTRNGLTSNHVNIVYRDRNETVLIGTTKGICSHRRGNFTTLGLFDKNILAFLRDGKGKLWAGTSEGAYYEESGKFTEIPALKGKKVNVIFENSKGVLWFGTDDGLFSMRQGDFINSGKNQLPASTVNAIIEDDKNILWIGMEDGLYKYNGREFTRYTIRKDLNSNSVSSLFPGMEGNIWIGSNNGLFRYRGDLFTTYTTEDGLENSFIYGIFRHRNELWIGTGNGVSVWNGKSFRNLGKKDGIAGPTVWSGLSRKKGNVDEIWLGTEGGATRIINGNIKTYTRRNGLTTDSVYVVFKDSDNRVWISGKNAVTLLTDDEKFQTFKFGNPGDNAFPVTIYEDRKGKIWFGCYQGGLYSFDGKKITDEGKQLSINSSSFMAIAEDGSGNLYFGSFDGLFIYDGKKVVRLSEKDGLNSDLIYIASFEANGKYLWVGTNQGLNRINTEKYLLTGRTNIENFGKEEGFTGVECNSNGVFHDYNGSIWFGTVNGLIHYKPSEYKPNQVRAKTHITNIRLFYTDTILGSGVELPYSENHISFEFIGICLTNPSKVQYRYMLEGFDKSMSPPGQENIATYPNLPPGKYTFKVISSNNEGLWNLAPATFTFEIGTPFWKTWWFSVMLVVLASGIITAVVRYRISQIRFRESIKAKLASNELKALRSQMNPHFIFNSLNSIQHFIINKDEDAASKYLNTFAKLIRMILNNSERSTASIREELDSLKLYLELEKLRFENKFDYTISVDSEIDPDYYEMPTMLIQPYVENAILHGLLPKQGDGKVVVEIKKQGQFIVCSITDNGIGRKKARELKEKSIKKTHKSFGMRITRDRLELLNNAHNSQLSLNIADLVSPSGEALGTQVEIFIPIA